MKKRYKERFDKLRQIGCMACGRNDPVIHHIRRNTGLSLRPDHDDTIPLCPQHDNMGHQSVHLNKKMFVSLFGTEEQLLRTANIKINQLE